MMDADHMAAHWLAGFAAPERLSTRQHRVGRFMPWFVRMGFRCW